VATGVPPSVQEAILRAEIGDLGVVRSLRDLPPRRLVAKLNASVGDFAPEAKEGFPRRLKWRHIAGPESTRAQQSDYIENADDLALRNPKQPTTPARTARRRPEATGEIKHSDWRPVNPSQPITDDLSIPSFLRRSA
jgi:hypothetical protein